MNNELNDLTGFRGERIFELCLTDYRSFSDALFRPGFLGEKWPAIDYYVELRGVRGRRLYFFAQVKTTRSVLLKTSNDLNISSKKKDIEHLLQPPGPTYLIGVHEPSQRVFIRSVHQGVASQAMTRIPLTNELTKSNLKRLHEEVRDFWTTIQHKPTDSVFR